MRLFDSFKKILTSSNAVNAKTKTEITISKNNLYIHPDLIDLIWIGDGKYKNYKNKATDETLYEFNGFTIRVSSFSASEPSTLYLSLPIKKPMALNCVDRPPYYPSYDELSPEQRWLYWKFLSDPYNPQNDIGYVFIFYYGLERHLLSGNFSKAFDIILKLRDVYMNKSFQFYSSSSLILTAMLYKKPDYAKKFVDSLDKQHEFLIPPELYYICKYGLNLPITAFDIMLSYKAFGFTNNRYIKNCPDIFSKNLSLNIQKFTGDRDFILTEDFFTKSSLSNLKTTKIPMFANVSIRDKEISVPNVFQPSKFTATVYEFLRQSHEDTKQELAEKRKTAKRESRIV